MVNKRLINTGVAVAAFDPLQNFETVTYTGNGGTQKITGYIRKGAAGFAYNKYITFPDMGGFTSNTSDSDGALSIWFSLNSIPASSSDYYTLIDRGNPNSYVSNYQAIELILKGTSNTNEVTFNFRRGFNGTNYDPSSYSATATTLSTNTWYHLVISYVASTKTATFYLDGTSIGSYSLTSSSGGRTIDSGFNIGTYANSSSYSAYAWNGKVDQFRIFNKALSQNEVTTLNGETYASSTKSTTDIFGDGSGVALYELDEDANDTGGTYNGTPTNVNFLGMAFQPDLVWIKNRSTAVSHCLFDSIRGAGTTNQLYSDSTSAQGADTTLTNFVSFDTNGFTLGATSGFNVPNYNGDNYVAWCFKGAGAAVSNTDGSITSQVSANQAAGFSIVKYTGNSTAGATVGHGLSSAPEFIIVKQTSSSTVNKNWCIYHASITDAEDKVLTFSTAAVADTADTWNDTAPTATSFTLGAGDDAYATQTNVSGKEYIAYCFHSVDGYQKVGSYSGNSSAAITVTTGFKPRFVMIKMASGTSSAYTGWAMFDYQRDIDSDQDNPLYANSSQAEGLRGNGSGSADNLVKITFDSDGFTVDPDLNRDGETNAGAGSTYIYLAIA